MNLDYNKMLFKMFMEQNAEKTFDDFGTLNGRDLKYLGVKLKEFKLTYYKHYVILEKPDDPVFLCKFNYRNYKFDGFSSTTSMNINILDHIKFEDKV